MGQLCGKEDHFDALSKTGSSGQRLGSASSSAPPTSSAPGGSAGVAGTTSSARGKSASTSPPQKLGGQGPAPADTADARERREAMLRAAEARGQKSTTRGTPAGGKLANQLASQGRDGGRAQEARLEAERRGEQLVWD
ncbi:hypothetical protein JCM10450v2_000318 [Rhodotorula kratochvilovae]